MKSTSENSFCDNDGWDVFQAFANEYGFFSHQIEHYNEFISHTLQQIIEKDPEITFENHTVLITNAIVENPSHREMDDTIADLYPAVSMKRDIPYNAKLYVDVAIKIPSKEVNEHGELEYLVRDHKAVNIGAIPVIVDSVVCNRPKIKNDVDKMVKYGEDVCCNGGFFITKGGAIKIISGQQQTASNQIYVFVKRNKPPKFDFFAEVRSTNTGFKSTTTRVGIKAGIISVHVPYIEGVSIPLGILFCALGTVNVKDMVKYIYPDTNNDAVLRILNLTFEASSLYKTQEDALFYIGSRGKRKGKGDQDTENSRSNIISYAMHLLSAELLPHVGSKEESFTAKKFYIGHMTAELIDTIIKKRTPEDRDHYGIKINASIGILFGQLFHTAYKKFRKEISKNIEKCVKQNEFINIQTIIKPSIIKNVMSNALTNGAWGGTNKTPGISQPYDRFNYGANLANARKLMTTINTEGGKIEAPRQLHGSHYRIACPSDTPEGKRCGLIGNLSLGAILATGCNKEEVIEIMKHEFNIHSVVEAFSPGNNVNLHNAKIFVNGYPLGFVDKPKEVVERMKKLRRRGDLLFEISIVLARDMRMIHIRTDPGRFLSPLLVVEDGSIRLTRKILEDLHSEDTPGSVWTKLLTRGYVEFLSKAEEESEMIAMYPSDIEEMTPLERNKIGYCEINPCLMFGIGTSQIPHSDSNQAPRNSYQAAMGKQSIGTPGANCVIQTKTKTYIMNYPQLPLIRTRATDILGISELPSGQNAIVAVCPWYGFGQEDSIILNQDSIDRGMFDVTVLLPYVAKIKKDKDEKVEIPREEECDNFRGVSTKLNPSTGYVRIGQRIEKGDILIGITIKMNPSATLQGKKKHSLSVIYDQKRPGIVHNIDHGTDGEGYEYVRVVIAQLRKPSVGDKFCYTKDHEVLTTEGWIGISKLKMVNKIATLSSGGMLEYQHPTKVVNFEYKGKMVEVNTNQVSLKVTPNHKMYVKRANKKEFKLESAEDLFDVHVHYKKNATWISDIPTPKYYVLEDRDNVLHKKKQLPMKEWLTFFGSWITDGWAANGKVGFLYSKKIKDGLCEVVNVMGYDLVFHQNHHCYIYDEQLCNHMATCSIGSIDKSLPSWVWKLDEEHSRILLHGICDRSVDDKMYHTSYSKLKDDVMRLALHCGWAANAVIDCVHKVIDDKNNTICEPTWVTTIIKSQTEPLVDKQTSFDYDGKVYCCTVPNHVIYVRNTNSNKPVWSGNSSHHSQKGTMSITFRSIDLPFDQEGVCPDVIIDPLAFPSRMTVGMTIEMMSGRKVCSGSFLNSIVYKKALNIDHCPDGEVKPFELVEYTDFSSCIDGTPFRKEFSVWDIINELTKLGINGFCDETMTNGQTGESMPCLIFNGICTYQRLKHMTEDKIHSRAEGGRTRITRQPKEGRKQGGGFRVGVMERDVIMAQGAAFFAKDRLLDQSDRTEEWFCRICGLQAIATAGNAKSGIPPIRECNVCGTNKVLLIEFTYATKLAIQELLGMNVVMRLILTEFDSETKEGDKIKVCAGKKKFKGIIKQLEK